MVLSMGRKFIETEKVRNWTNFYIIYEDSGIFITNRFTSDDV